jgi:hypothetical protein
MNVSSDTTRHIPSLGIYRPLVQHEEHRSLIVASRADSQARSTLLLARLRALQGELDSPSIDGVSTTACRLMNCAIQRRAD